MNSDKINNNAEEEDNSTLIKHIHEFSPEDQHFILHNDSIGGGGGSYDGDEDRTHIKFDKIVTTTTPSVSSGLVNIVNNKGTGAGGSNTNANGKTFEEKTNNERRLLELGYIKHTYLSKSTTTTNTKKHDYYLLKTFEDKTIVFVLQNGLKRYMKYKYNITDICRCPDEAYIIEYNNGKKVIKILEKKHQTHEGSVETKLWAGPSLKREYELILGGGGYEFEVVYGFCVSDFLKYKLLSNEKKYIILNIIFTESNIVVLFGDDEDNYFNTLDIWINNSL
jgi:hypothetical protein